MKKKLIIDGLTEATLKKLKRLKENEGYATKNWASWFNYHFKQESIKDSASQVVDNSTRDNMLEMWVKSFALNLFDIRSGYSISDLVPENAEQIDLGNKPPYGRAVIVGAGPSLWSHNHLDLLKQYVKDGNYKGLIIATDRMIIPLLERDIIPDYSVGVDGSPIIKNFYDHPLIEKFGDQLKVIINATTDHTVVDQCNKNKVKIFWFNPLFDDPNRESNESLTKLQRIMTISDKHPKGLCSMSCGGNCGSAAWVITHSLLRRGNIALIGVDIGYPEGYNLEETPYFSALQYADDPTAMVGQFFKTIYHPVFKTKAYVDKIFNHYRETWKQMVLQTAPWINTYNCTEGGTLFGERIKCMKFADWLYLS